MPVELSDAEKLARAVRLYFKGSPWTADDSDRWQFLTGTRECNSRTLCDFARAIERKEERENSG